MDILTEHREGEITVFTNNSTPEIHLTTRRAEAKEEVAENMVAVTTVADNMEEVKGAAKYAQTFDDVLLNLPTIIKAMPAAETAVQAKDDAIVAKESAQESAEKAESAVVRAEEVTAEQVELAKGYAEQAKTEVSKISSAFKIVGTVPTVEDLPKNAEVGNIYLVGDNSITNKPEYVWTPGGTWEKFGETVDLSAYQTKEEAETALAEKQDTLTAGEGIKIEGNVISTEGGKLPDNVYTQDNLIAGKNVTFEDKKITVGLDDNTIALFHFDGNAMDSSNHKNSGVYTSNGLTGATDPTFIEGKFGMALNVTKSNLDPIYYSNDAFTSADCFTVDYWIYLRNIRNNNSEVQIRLNNDSTMVRCFAFCSYGEKHLWILCGSDTIYDAACDELKLNDWNHLAVQVGKDNTCKIFVNGKLITATTTNVPTVSSIYRMNIASVGDQYIDELRLSNVERYDVDFTPETKAYNDVSETKTVKAVNASVPTKLSELENDAGFITGGGSAEIPDNVYTAENLVSGDNISFTPKKAVFNADIVGSPVISDNYEVSGFSDNDYLEIDDPINAVGKYNSFEIGFAFNANTLATSNAGIYDGGEGGSGGYRITIHYQNARVRIITSSSGYYGVDLIGSTTLDTGKKYYAKVNYSSETGYTLSLKEEGGEWVVDASTSDTTTPYPARSRRISIGDNKGGAGFTFDGTIYLPEMYINIDGKRAWTGFLPDRTVVSADNVYTQYNLLGGKDIEIVPEPVEGGIDEYTLGVFHFDDGYKVNAVDGKEVWINQAQILNSDYAKFGTKSGQGFHDGYNTAYVNYYHDTGLTEEGDWTVDHWARFPSSGSKYQASLGVGNDEDSYDWWVKFQTDTQMAYVLTNPTGTVVTKASSPISLPINEWVHLAAEKRGDTINGYLNGVKVISFTDSSVRNTLTTRRLETYPYCYIDELRFCTVARYKGEDFTPPTKAYEVAVPTGNMVINFTGEKLQKGADYVVESYNDGTNWYRVYKSGWIEQGGVVSSSTGEIVISMLKPLKDANYTLLVTATDPNVVCTAHTLAKTNTSFKMFVGGLNGSGQTAQRNWSVFGQGA